LVIALLGGGIWLMLASATGAWPNESDARAVQVAEPASTPEEPANSPLAEPTPTPAS